MIPLHDNIPSRTVPFINYGIIAACTIVFLGQISNTTSGNPGLVEQFGMIPVQVLHPKKQIVIRERVLEQTPLGGYREGYRDRTLSPPAVNPWLTLLTCTFLHGGWMHFIGNMWFLHIFGDNVEDRLGHFGYLLFYLGCGIAASAAHLLTDTSSAVPTIGASGAIAGVMGAYLLLYPHAKVQAIVPLIIFVIVAVVPAPVFLGLWFLLQLFQGSFVVGGTQASGVAWWAHIGGFVAGLSWPAC